MSIFMLSIATSGISQDYDENYEYEEDQIKEIYKIGLGKILVSQFFFGYERVVSDHFSLNAQAGYLIKAFYLETLSEMNRTLHIRTQKTPGSQFFKRRTSTSFGAQINLELRYYPFKFEGKFFIGIKGGYQYANFGDDLKVTLYIDVLGDSLNSKVIDTKQNSYFYGGTIGSNFILREKRTLEFYLVVGRRHSQLINPEPFVPDLNFQGTYMVGFQNNHLNPVDKLHLEFGIYLGIGK